MAIEIANVVAAAGTFVPNPSGSPGDFPTSIPSSMGFKPVDPNTTTLAPKGGFTKVATGNYVMQMVEPINTLESAVQGSVRNQIGQYLTGSLVLPSLVSFAPQSDFASVFVSDENGDLVDPPMFQVVVFRYATGPNFATEINL